MAAKKQSGVPMVRHVGDPAKLLDGLALHLLHVRVPLDSLTVYFSKGWLDNPTNY